MSARRKETNMWMCQRRRRGQLAVAAALGVLGVMSVPSSASAAGAAYNVLQCHDNWRAASEMPPVVPGSSRYSAVNKCGTGDARLEVTNWGAALNGQGGWFAFNAPPGTSIREVHLDANLRRGSHHLAQIAVWNGTNNVVLANGPDTNPSWQHYDWGGLSDPALVLLLQCQDAGGCPADSTAHMYARNVHVVLTDWYDPALSSAGGSLLNGGWLRGGQTLSASATDVGSGIGNLDGEVNGQLVARAGSCNNGGLAAGFSGYAAPCAGSAAFSQTFDTSAAPFRNGENIVRCAARDFAGNATAVTQRTVLLDNEKPSVAFANAQDPDDPELIRAPVSDGFSGIATARLYMRQVGATDWIGLDTKVDAGAALARVDSASLPAGEYEFKATVSDVAGNTAETTARKNGDPMKLTFPLRAPARLQAHLANGGSNGQTVPYGTDSKVQGRLVDANGDPIAGKEVLIDEDFGEGALIRHRPTTVTTDENGRFESKVPAGPTRRIDAAFDGTTKYAADRTDVGELTVKSRASFELARKRVPEGATATFEGKVGHVGARIPSGGKLLELQVRLKTGRWDTVGEAFRTSEKGRYKRHYRFGKHYTQDTLFRFRVKVLKERNWPYKRAASKQRKLVVRAN
jgi:hypothetical protein